MLIVVELPARGATRAAWAFAASVAVVPGFLVRIPTDAPAAEFDGAAAGRAFGDLWGVRPCFDRGLVSV
jgi:hypothetical protein